MGQFSNRSQTTPERGKKISDIYTRLRLKCYLFVLNTFYVICDLLLNRLAATWNLFVKVMVNECLIVFLTIYSQNKLLSQAINGEPRPLCSLVASLRRNNQKISSR